MFGNSSRSRKTGQSGRRPQLTYYSSRSKDDYGRSPFTRQVAKTRLKLKSLFKRTADVMLIAVIIISLAYSLLIQPQAIVMLSSEVYHPLNDYQESVQRQLTSLKNRNKATFDEGGVVKKLRSQFPEISQAVIELPLFGQKPKVKITIAQPSFWLQSGGNKFIVDQQGTV